MFCCSDIFQDVDWYYNALILIYLLQTQYSNMSRNKKKAFELKDFIRKIHEMNSAVDVVLYFLL